jgi:hypothetical protein
MSLGKPNCKWKLSWKTFMNNYKPKEYWPKLVDSSWQTLKKVIGLWDEKGGRL